MPTHTIPFESVAVAAMTARMRRRNGCSTGLFCALTPRPKLDVDCGRNSVDWVYLACQTGTWHYTGPLQRGRIAQVWERTARERGAAEVRRTWGVGIRALRAECRHVLHGGLPC
jgi:hypothetical protein